MKKLLTLIFLAVFAALVGCETMEPKTPRSYTETTWRNNLSPYLNETNLNKIEEGIRQAHLGYYVDDEDWDGDIDLAVSEIGSTNYTVLFVKSAAVASANVTLPAKMTLILLPGGTIDWDSNNFTINGKFINLAGSSAISNEGTVTYGSSATHLALSDDGNLHLIGASPDLVFKDSDCTDADVNARIQVVATDTDSGEEDIDIYIKQQEAGADDQISVHIDADGDITLGRTDQNVVVADDLTVTGLLNLNGGIDLPFTAKTSNYTVTADDAGTIFTNSGATDDVTFAFPEASTILGQPYWFLVVESHTMNVNPDDNDCIKPTCDTDGDQIQNTGTEGNMICLMAYTANTIAVFGKETGTWSDAD